jgi:uroporphyrinogen decarboxylase
LKPQATRPKFGRVFETVARLRQDLPHETTLIGFCGAPWTVATYMVAGGGSSDQADARGWAYRDPAGFQALIDLLTDVSVDYLSGQVQAGADVLQIFDTWAGSLPDNEFARWVTAPTKTMVAKLKAKHPDVPIIAFPRGAGQQAARFVRETGVDGVSCDTSMPLEAMAELAKITCVQGNLDPLLLVAGGEAMDARVDALKQAMAGKPYIFNLGHGIVPPTPPENVTRLLERLRKAA